MWLHICDRSFLLRFDPLVFWSDFEVLANCSTQIRLGVTANYSQFVRVPPKFLENIESLSLCGTIRQQSWSRFLADLQNTNSTVTTLAESFAAMPNLKKISFERCIVPPLIIMLQESPLTNINLYEAVLTKPSLDQLSDLIKTIDTLREVDLSFRFHSTEAGDYDVAPLFAAVAQSKAVRKFSYWEIGQKSNEMVLLSALKMIQNSKTLRQLSLTDVLANWRDTERLMLALANNESIEIFYSELKSKDTSGYLSLKKDSKMTEQLVKALTMMIQQNRALQEFSVFAQNVSFSPIYDQDRVDDAFCGNRSLHHLLLGESGNLLEENLGGRKEENEQELKEDLLNVLTIGRSLCAVHTIQGKFIPGELMDYILRQATTKRLWNDSIWRPIRRAALDRNTLGDLILPASKLDPYEFLYYCRGLYH